MAPCIAFLIDRYLYTGMLLPLVLTFTNLIELPYSFAGSFLKSPGIRLAVSSFPTFTPYIFLLSTASVQLSNTTSGWKQ